MLFGSFIFNGNLARRAKPSSLSCEMVFIIFSFEKERSALDNDWQYSEQCTYTVARSGTDDRIPELLISLSKSSMDSELSSDFRVEFAPK